MAVLKYLRKEGPVHKCSALSKKVIEQVNELVRQVLMPYEMQQWESNAVLLEVPTLIIPPIEDRVKIGKYTTENGPAGATRHFSGPKTTTKRPRLNIFGQNRQ